MKYLLRATLQHALLFSTVFPLLLFQSSNLWAQQNSASNVIAQIESGIPYADDTLAKLSIEELMERLNVPGVSVAVIRDYDIHWSKGYGTADVVAGTPVDTETLFQAASISKPVNAMAVLKAAEDGHFSMDQDINTVITNWQIPESQFTQDTFVSARMLASHTAGLGDGFGFPGYDPGAPLPTLPQIFDGEAPSNVGIVRVVRPPMSAYHYSGGGVTILQQALIDTYDVPYAQLMQELVLSPAGMNQSTYEQPLPAERDRNAARAHSFQGEAAGPKWHVYPEQAAAGLWTTPTDLAKFAIEVQLSAQNRSNAVLNQESTKQMLSPVGVGPFAVGFSIAKRGEGWYFDHGGSNFGFQAQLTAHLSKGYGYAIMTNSSSGRRLIQELARRIEASYYFDSQGTAVPR